MQQYQWHPAAVNLVIDLMVVDFHQSPRGECRASGVRRSSAKSGQHARTRKQHSNGDGHIGCHVAFLTDARHVSVPSIGSQSKLTALLLAPPSNTSMV